VKPSPPNRPLRFLRWFCREDYLEEIEGDLVEVFEKQYESSPRTARWWFTSNVIRYFRPEFVKSFASGYSPNTIAMFRHNFLLTYRIFKRYKSSFFINLTGLSVGLASALLIFLWVNDELKIDKFHEKDDQLYQVYHNVHRSDGITTMGNTSYHFFKDLKEEMPEVEYAVAVMYRREFTLSFENINIKATGQYVSEDFFNVFSFRLTHGDKDQVLNDHSSIILSSELAMNLFGTTKSVLGKFVEFQHGKLYSVSGIFEDVPSNSSEQFDFLLPLEEGSGGGIRTYIVLREGTKIDLFNDKIADFKQRKDAPMRINYFLKHYSDYYLYNIYKNGKQAGGRIENVRLFSAIAVLIIVIASINFMNLSTARASRRSREVGIKKAVGAGRRSLIFQYLGESVFMAFSSLLVAIITVLVLLPHFNTLTGKQLALDADLNLISSILIITLLTGLVAGSYSALYLSGFKPATVLKGGLTNSSGGQWARRGLVVFQFALSVILIVSVIVVFKQIEYVQTKNLGYDRENILYFDMEGKVAESPGSFLSEVKNIPGVVTASSLDHSMSGWYRATSDVQWVGKDPDTHIGWEIFLINYDLIETLGMEMAEGRSFSRDFVSDSSRIIVNETAINLMKFTDPVGESVKFGSHEYEIVGVVNDFHYTSLRYKLVPVVMFLTPNITGKIMARIEAGREPETIKQLEALHQSYNPGFVMDYKFQEHNYQALYKAEELVATLSRYFAGIAVLVSCLGLLGLAAFTADRRLKEMGIRKILGAGNFSIIRLLSDDFTRIVLVAIVIALPVSYFMTAKWLEGFAFRIELEWWFFVIAGLAALLIAWLTVGVQTIKAAHMNPVECLRDE